MGSSGGLQAGQGSGIKSARTGLWDEWRGGGGQEESAGLVEGREREREGSGQRRRRGRASGAESPETADDRTQQPTPPSCIVNASPSDADGDEREDTAEDLRLKSSRSRVSPLIMS